MFKHNRLASLRRNLFEPLDALRSGTPRLKYWKDLERTQYLSEAALRQIQWDRLKKLLSYAWDNNDFYRKRFEQSNIVPTDIKTSNDFLKIPLLSKKTIRDNIREIISRTYANEPLLRFKTGGSTGKALDIYMTEECSELRNACARRHDRWTGWEPGEPIGAVWGNPDLHLDLKKSLKDWFLSPYIYLDTMCMTKETVQAFAAQWQKVRPTLLYGHAHSLFVLAEYVRDYKIHGIQPKGILSTSMMLLPNERSTIEDVFDLKVTDRYGCEEVSLIGSECEYHAGMHLNIEHLYVEFIKNDGSTAAPGESGRIVVTDLMNRAMPFIRYQVEDLGVPSDRICRCGRGLPLMESITGRVADFLLKRDGSKVAGVSLIENTLTHIPGIDQMQIIQETLDNIVIRIVPGRDFQEVTRQQLSNYFKNLFGEGVDIKISNVKEIQPEPSGKYRFSICRVKDNAQS